MIRIDVDASGWIAVCALALAVIPLQQARAEHTLEVLHAFAGGTDGAFPFSPLVMDKAGNLYGTTLNGGDGTACGGNGCGTVFKISTDGGRYSILHSFSGGDGSEPMGGVTLDDEGHLFGTTSFGGAVCDAGNYTCGTVFKMSTNGSGYRVLYNFKGSPDGAIPWAQSIIVDQAGNLYGTTAWGGAYCFVQCGTVFKIATDGSETILHSFGGGEDGKYAFGGLVADRHGALWGTTFVGGTLGAGTVFKIEPDGSGYKVVYAFDGTDDGGLPAATLIEKGGLFFGTTYGGGDAFCNGTCGTVFMLTPRGGETVLYSFVGGADGGQPFGSGVIIDRAGDLYGTTSIGGGTGCTGPGCGAIYKLPAGDIFDKVLYSFGTGGNGKYPVASLVADDAGYLYGTAEEGGGSGCGGVGCGVVYRVKK